MKNPTPSSRPRRSGRCTPVAQTRARWITFSELARMLGLPSHGRRWLQRRLLGTQWEELLAIQPVEQGHARALPTPPDKPVAWVIARTRVVQHKVELCRFLGI